MAILNKTSFLLNVTTLLQNISMAESVF